jgi:hypothetical protein
MVINASARKFKLEIESVDVSDMIVGNIIFNPIIEDYSGLFRFECNIQLSSVYANSTILDPWFNSIFAIGSICKFWIENDNQTLVPCPVYGHSRIASQPAYQLPDNENSDLLEIKLVDEITYWDEEQPTSNCTGIDPKIGIPRWQVISNLWMHVTSGQTMPSRFGYPSDIMKYPPQPGSSLIQLMGLIAHNAPEHPWYIWADHTGQLRMSKEPSNNDADYVGILDAIRYRRTNSSEYARPLPELEITGTMAKVTAYPFPKVNTPVETFIQDPRIPNSPTLVSGNYSVETLNGNIRTIYEIIKFDFITLVGNSQGTSAAPTKIRKISLAYKHTYTYRNIPSDWDSCNLANNADKNAGLLDKYEKITYEPLDDQYGDIEITVSTAPSVINNSRPIRKEVVTYTYTPEQWISKKTESSRLPLYQLPENLLISPLELYESGADPYAQTGFGLASYRVTNWSKVGCDAWKQENIEYGVDGKYDSVYKYDVLIQNIDNNGVAQFSYVGGATDVTKVTDVKRSVLPITENAPETLQSLPLQYDVCQEKLSYKSTLGNYPTNKRKPKTIVLNFLTSQPQLEELTKYHHQLYFQRSFGWDVTINMLDQFTNVNTQPKFTADFIDPTNNRWKVKALGWMLALNSTQCMVELKCPAIGIYENGMVRSPWGEMLTVNTTPIVPINAVTVDGEVVTSNGEIVTT